MTETKNNIPDEITVEAFNQIEYRNFKEKVIRENKEKMQIIKASITENDIIEYKNNRDEISESFDNALIKKGIFTIEDIVANHLFVNSGKQEAAE